MERSDILISLPAKVYLKPNKIVFSLLTFFCYNEFMELSKREIPEILKYYRVDDLGLVFDGYEPIGPDSRLYYFHNISSNDLYALLLTDYVGWGIGNEEPVLKIVENYYPGHECDWNVEKWLTCRDELDETDENGDYEGWFYWPECGDKCVFAKLKEKAPVLEGRSLKKELPEQISKQVVRPEIDSERN